MMHRSIGGRRPPLPGGNRFYRCKVATLVVGTVLLIYTVAFVMTRGGDGHEHGHGHGDGAAAGPRPPAAAATDKHTTGMTPYYPDTTTDDNRPKEEPAEEEETLPGLNLPDYKMLDTSITCDVVDIVYTWVNGSDPAHKKSKESFGGAWDGGYRDYGVLKYSMRSVEKFMPWIRNIILVTNGQVPTWANPNAPGFRVVTHEEIFPNPDDLPTFNSNAIEANLHNIPDLAPCLLYMNDDMFLAREIPRNFYFNPDNGVLNLYMSRAFTAPMKDKMAFHAWHASIGFSNELLNAWYHPENKEEPHKYVAHHCYFMRHDVMDVMYHRWHEEFDRTSRHKFRQRADTALPFLAANVALEENLAVSASSKNIFGTWKPDEKENAKWWKDTWAAQPYCVCINDGLDNSLASIEQTNKLQRLFEEKFPTPSRAEW
ncbi:Stealth protein CR1, conserved region 1 [Pelomyxa schiedti]|nr:Stealth protein CR1, conserved region 1 [Pelomyxa schiedti]